MRQLILLIFLFASSVGPQRAAAADIAECSLATGPVQQLCAAVYSAADASAQLPPSVLDLFSWAAIPLVTKGKLSQIELDEEIRAHASSGVQKYCRDIAKGSNLDPQLSAVTVACLRPVCLSDTKYADAAVCTPAKQYRVALHRAALAAAKATLPKSAASQPCTSECIQADPDVLRSVALSDQWLTLISIAIRSQAAPSCVLSRQENLSASCASELANFATRIMRIWLQGSAIAASFEEVAAIRNAIDPTNKFSFSWSEVKGSVNSQSSSNFITSPSVIGALLKAEVSVGQAVSAIGEQVRRGRLETAFGIYVRGARIADLKEPLFSTHKGFSEFSEIWKKIASKVSNPQMAIDVEPVAPYLLSLEPSLSALEKIWKESRISVRIDASESDCSDRSSKGHISIDTKKGFLDRCLGSSALPLVGTRFVFAPCATDQLPCRTSGDVRLLIRDSGGKHVYAIPIGFHDVLSEVTSTSINLSQLPPLRNFVFDKEALASALERITPPPLSFEVLAADLKSGPNVQLSLRPSIKGLSVVGEPITIGIGEDSNWSVAAESALQSIDAALTGQFVSIGGFGLTDIHILTSRNPSCGDFKGRPKMEEVALCGMFSVPLSKFGANLGLRDERVPIIVRIGKSGAPTLTVQSGGALLLTQLNDALAKALPPSAPKLIRFEAVEISSRSLVVLTQIGDARFRTDEIPFGGASAARWIALIGEWMKEAVFQSLTTGLKDDFELFGLHFHVTAGGACAAIQGKQACLLGVKGAPAALDFSSARVQDQGLIGSYLAEKVQLLLPGGNVRLSRIETRGKDLIFFLKLNTPLISQGVEFELSSGRLNDQFQAMAYMSIANELTSLLKDQQLALGSFAVSKPTFAGSASGVNLIKASLEFGSKPTFTATVSAKFLPALGDIQIHVEQSALQLFAQQALASLIQATGSKASSFQLFFDPNGGPALRVPLTAAIPIGITAEPIKAEVVLEARPQRSARFAGPLALTLPIWLPAFAGIEVGNLQGEIDLNNSSQFAIGASLAFAKGETSHSALELHGRLEVKLREDRVALLGSLRVAGQDVLRSDGIWMPKRGLLTATTGAAGALSALPIPQISIILDGQYCALGGTASTKLAGIDLINLNAGLLLGSRLCKTGAHPSSDIVNRLKACPRDSYGTACVAGRANFGGLGSAEALFATSIPIPNPSVAARLDFNFAKFDLNARLAMVQLGTSVFGFHVDIILPTVANVTPDVLRRLLENLLHLSLDLEHLDHVVISPFPPGDSAATSASPKGSKSGNGSVGQQAPGSEAQRPSRPVQQQTGSNSQRHSQVLTSAPGQDVIRIVSVNDRVSKFVRDLGTGKQIDLPSLMMLKEDAELFNGGGKYRLIPGEPKGLFHGRPFILACADHACTTDKIAVVPLLVSVNDPDPDLDIRIPSLDLTALSNNLLSGFDAGHLPLPSLAVALAIDVLKKQKVSVVVCLRRIENSCWEAASRREIDGQPNWYLHRRYSRNSLIVSNDSLFGSLLSERCATGCTEDRLRDLSEVEEAHVVAAWPSSGTPKFALFQWPRLSLFGFLRAETFARGLSSKHGAAYDFDMSIWSLSAPLKELARFKSDLSFAPAVASVWNSSISNPLWEEVTHQFQAHASAAVDRPWTIKNRLVDSQEFVAAISPSPLSTAQVLSGLMLTTGKACVRIKSYQDILTELRSWSDGSPDARTAGFADKQVVDELTVHDKEGMLLITVLSNPEISQTGFRANPLRLLGVPEATCLN